MFFRSASARLGWPSAAVAMLRFHFQMGDGGAFEIGGGSGCPSVKDLEKIIKNIINITVSQHIYWHFLLNTLWLFNSLQRNMAHL